MKRKIFAILLGISAASVLSACNDGSGQTEYVQSESGYASCAEAKKSGQSKLSAPENPRIDDRDHDGIVCE